MKLITSRLLGPFFAIILSILTLLKVNGNPQVPCYFIFGDSLSDAGNNNNLQTKALANYLPYGIDFLVNGSPTGRFTNGHTIVDFIAQSLNFQEPIAPFSTANDQQILEGVNYASGSAGINAETGGHLGDRVSLGQQLDHHKTIISRLGAASQNLGSCLYTMYIGSNDYINNYFMPEFYSSSKRFNQSQYADNLVAQYDAHIRTLYNSGARKMAIFGLGKVGCALAQIVRFKSTTCIADINNAVAIFNQKLETLVRNLNTALPGSRFAFVNVQAIDVGPQQGITVLDKPCCILREDYQCQESSSPCNDRNTHYFWDGFHPTEAANKAIGAAALNAINPIL